MTNHTSEQASEKENMMKNQKHERRPARFLFDMLGKITGLNPEFLRHRQMYGGRSKSQYMPHQGEREKARRRRQDARDGIVREQ